MVRARQVIASSNGSLPAGSTACASGLLIISDREGGALLPAAAAFCSSASAFFSVAAGPVADGCCEWSTSAGWQPTRHTIATQAATHIRRISRPRKQFKTRTDGFAPARIVADQRLVAHAPCLQGERFARASVYFGQR